MRLDELDGGKGVLQRMLDAYGFTMQKQLGEMHGLSSGTISTWVRRDYFPGDVVVACALDTGVSLHWLATGKGDKYEAAKMESNPETERALKIPSHLLSSGKLTQLDGWIADKSIIPDDAINPCYLKGSSSSWIVDLDINEVSNGRWLLIIDGYHDIYDVSRIPNNRIQVHLYGSNTQFECSSNEIDCVGRVLLTINKNN